MSKVFVPRLSKVYEVSRVEADGVVVCVHVVRGQLIEIRFDPAEQQVIPLSQVLAAPAMYEALKELNDILEALIKCDYAPSEAEVNKVVLGPARIAIAAAEVE